jgi:hypothetical protein
VWVIISPLDRLSNEKGAPGKSLHTGILNRSTSLINRYDEDLSFEIGGTTSYRRAIAGLGRQSES